MPNSLKSKLSKLRYKGQITEEEYKDLIKKLAGHDREFCADWLSTFNTDSATDCFTAVQQLKEKIYGKNSK